MLFFDIETECNPDAIQHMPEPTAPGNYKDEAKIAAYIEEKRQEQIQRAALDADYGRITAIGIKMNATTKSESFMNNGDMEDVIIREFWDAYKYHHGQSCGYNIIGFDLPYLMRRSFALGIKPSVMPDLRRYQTQPTLDLMAILYNWGTAKGLKTVCQLYGINNPLPDLDGSQVAGMDTETLRAYVENDVNLVYELHQKMSGVYF